MAMHAPTVRVQLPPDVDNDERAAVLFAPFRGKGANLTSWDSKMKFWQHFLEKTALENNLVTIDLATLPHLFTRKGLTPKCLPTVIEELHRLGKIKPLDEFKRSNSWLSWGFSTLVKEPLSWGVNRVLFGSPKKSNSVYVWQDVLKNVCDKVITHIQSKIHQGIIHHVCTYQQFEDFSGEILADKDHFELVMNHLQTEKRIYLKQTTQLGVLVKVYERNKTSVSPFQDLDVQIFEIHSASLKIERELNNLSTKIEGLTDEARLNVKNKNKTMALHCLRKRKHLEKTASAKSSILHSLEEILQKIEDADINLAAVQACEAGAAVLKKMNKETSIEKVENVMDTVQETLQEVEDVSAAISSIGQGSDEYSNVELERELDSLLNEDVKIDSSKTSSKELFDDLPDLTKLSLSDVDLPEVPTHDPASSDFQHKTDDEIKRNLDSLLSS